MILQEKVPRVSVRTRTINEFTVRLARPITNPDDFAEEFQALMAAGEQDVVRLDIASVGGNLDTCVMIRRAMQNCAARTVGWIGPTCASAASAIALQCDGWEVDDMSSFMIHTASFGVPRDKTPNVVASALHTEKMVETFVRTVYTGFLSEQEIVQALGGKDFYFCGEELADRLEAFAKYRKESNEDEPLAA